MEENMNEVVKGDLCVAQWKGCSVWGLKILDVSDTQYLIELFEIDKNAKDLFLPCEEGYIPEMRELTKEDYIRTEIWMDKWRIDVNPYAEINSKNRNIN